MNQWIVLCAAIGMALLSSLISPSRSFNDMRYSMSAPVHAVHGREYSGRT